MAIIGFIVGALLGSSRESAQMIPPAIIVLSLIQVGCQIGLAWHRLKNIGMNTGWAYLLLIPIVGLIVHVRCLIFQEDYEYGDPKKLDSTGKTLATVVICIFALPILLGIIAGIISMIAG